MLDTNLREWTTYLQATQYYYRN